LYYRVYPTPPRSTVEANVNGVLNSEAEKNLETTLNEQDTVTLKITPLEGG